jgi:phosphatidylglycerophosphatase A
MTRAARAIATAAGLGFAPVAPGTVGAAAGVVYHLATRHWSPGLQVLGLVLLSLMGVWAAGLAAQAAGREDPSHVVVDEVAGQAVTLAFFDLGAVGLLIGFGLFRLFDIAKPFPIRRFERLPRGWGIMADDIVAGVYGWLSLKALVTWQPGLF